MHARNVWSRILIIAGYILMLVGAIDPLEGSLLILPGSGMVVLGVNMARIERRLVIYRLWVFIMIAIGIGALWGLSLVGGIGGPGGRSIWWGVLILPYFVGWSMAVWGPGSPRWVLWLGIAVALWYLTIFAMSLKSLGSEDWLMFNLAAVVLGVVGVLTIVGCVYRLRNSNSV